MARIEDNNPLYNLIRRVAVGLYRLCFRKVEYTGLERIPHDGVIIYAPNHTSGLCDPLAILSLDDSPKVFVGRADLFRIPYMGRILTWCKMMPIFRMRDGINQVRDNNDTTIHQVLSVLKARVPFCIFPEGTHRAEREMLPLSKGIFRIALQAEETFGTELPIYIVPVGIVYGDLFHLWSPLRIHVGEPIRVDELVQQYAKLERPQLMLKFRDELTCRMQDLSAFTPLEQHPLWWGWRVVLFPLFIVSAVVTSPLWICDWIVRRTIEDKAFINSWAYAFFCVSMILTFGTIYPFWAMYQEYLYRLSSDRRHC